MEHDHLQSAVDRIGHAIDLVNRDRTGDMSENQRFLVVTRLRCIGGCNALCRPRARPEIARPLDPRGEGHGDSPPSRLAHGRAS
jgi:hypothetical protein